MRSLTRAAESQPKFSRLKRDATLTSRDRDFEQKIETRRKLERVEFETKHQLSMKVSVHLIEK